MYALYTCLHIICPVLYSLHIWSHVLTTLVFHIISLEISYDQISLYKNPFENQLRFSWDGYAFLNWRIRLSDGIFKTTGHFWLYVIIKLFMAEVPVPLWQALYLFVICLHVHPVQLCQIRTFNSVFEYVGSAPSKKMQDWMSSIHYCKPTWSVEKTCLTRDFLRQKIYRCFQILIRWWFTPHH